MTGPVVAVDGLRVEVAGRTLLDGVSLRVHPGRVTALLGASGSGKTTTGLALLGEYPSGARVRGRVDVPAGAVGYIPQQPASALNPARRVGALLRDIARLRGAGLPDVRTALLRAQLTDPDAVLRRYPHQLSGGQQQRVVLAQALLLGARAIVADEPTTGQDPPTKLKVVEELSSVVRQGIGVLLLSHDLDVVRELADEVVVLRDGRVVESGPADRLPAGPKDDRTGPASAPSTRPRRSAPGPHPVLTVESLRASHPGRVQVLHGIDVEVGPGECLAVVGSSGSGKTTLGRCIAGLHDGYRGRVTLDGRRLAPSLRHRTRSELASVQYVFQDARAAFDEHRPVAAQVARAAVRLRGAGRDEAERTARRLLAELGLSEAQITRRPGGLSGGELQRAALARALAARPRLLICDEITSGLDAVSRHAALGLLTGLRERAGLALVLITHDLAAARAVGDRFVTLDRGRVVEQDMKIITES
ncbi:ATP-binding cassette domain-containing protein [Streptomyces sp. CB01881]|uniref:ABC transporter ATP-binding protein n=1 Tax=Streptomyces sp. CB01881 TaxID=2078691 RepID=UPI000CDC1F6E|nr:ATP-binding cassette domain-containing protein [Streptomyces sp. CB01881]AUY52597.1 ABC transporter ATP-binding protein [Streptomyces sp. CB01881]TYC70316.1 ABC transporter ATP-binding protein [Streptomyces sp. CB01881]